MPTTSTKHVHLIIFEGLDGVGKTTQLQLVQNALKKNNVPTQSSRLPGGTPIGEELRSVMMGPHDRPALSDFYMALASQEALIDSLNKSDKQKIVTLLDRSPISTAAYQIYGSGIDAQLGWSYVDDALKRLQPDLIIIYDCPLRLARERAAASSSKSDYFESKPSDYFERVQHGYHAALKRYNAVLIDASRNVDSVFDQTMQLVSGVVKPTSLS